MAQKFRILEDVNHMGGKKAGDTVSIPDGAKPRGQLNALLKFGQAEPCGPAADAPRRGKAPAKAVKAEKVPPGSGTETTSTGGGK